MDCWAKMGAMLWPARRIDSTWPGVARPIRSPKPKLGFKPRVVTGDGSGTWGSFGTKRGKYIDRSAELGITRCLVCRAALPPTLSRSPGEGEISACLLLTTTCGYDAR